MMQTGAAGLRLIKEFEGCKEPMAKGYFKPYVCPAGVLTIGWGHTNHHGRKFDEKSIWTQFQCDRALSEDLSTFEKAVHRLVKVKLNQNQFDALVSFAYNCGEGNLAKSTLLKRVNAGDFEGAAQEFHKWNKGAGVVLRGLVRRRKAESDLFRSKVIPPIPEELPRKSPDPMPQEVDPPKADRKSIFERLWTWVSGSGIAGLAAFFTDWRVVLVIVLSLIFVGGSFILFMGPDRVRQWIREHVNR
jgi:lysozyme